MTTPGQDAEERPKEKAGRKERWTVFGWQIANCCGSRQLGRISKVVPFLPHKRCVYHYSIPSSLWARYEQTSLKPPIALTIDDAPGRHDSVNNALLDLFKDHNVRATFFIISGHVKDHEEVCRRMVREGHELGNHSTEDRAVADLSEGEFEARLTECENILDSLRETAGGQREEGNDGLNRKKWFRPPCAALSWKMCSVLEKKGFTNVLADVYALDEALGRSEDFIIDFVKKKTQPGSIVVLHSPSDSFRQHLKKVLWEVVPFLAERFRCVTLSELAAEAEGRLPGG